VKKRLILALVLVLLLEPWIVSLIRCEVLTAKYADTELLEAVNTYQAYMVIDSLKVLDYEPYSYCRVYGKNEESGNVFILTYDSDESRNGWNVVHWDTIWSKAGNADRFIWPYIR